MNKIKIHINFIILLLAFAIVQAKLEEKKYCDVFQEGSSNQCYSKETLITMSHSPHQLAMDKETNTLYFSFDSGQGEYVPALYKLETKELTVLKGVRNAFAIAYDSMRKEMFFGGTHGIYRFNTKLKSLKRLNIDNLDIWWLFPKNDIYFIKFPSLNVYSYSNRTIKSFPVLSDNVVHQMVIDVNDNKLFINNSGLYGMHANQDKAALLRENPRFINMATDNYGFVYICSDDGIYVVNKIVQKVKRLITIHGVLGFTFDKFNNIIYSDSHEIVRLILLNNKN